MAKHNTSVDSVEEDVRRELGSIRNPNYRTRKVSTERPTKDGRSSRKDCAVYHLSVGAAVGSTSAVVMEKLGVYSVRK